MNRLWIDWPRPQTDAINRDMRAAHESFDLAYHRSPSAAQLKRRAAETIRHLTAVINTIDEHQSGGPES